MDLIFEVDCFELGTARSCVTVRKGKGTKGVKKAFSNAATLGV